VIVDCHSHLYPRSYLELLKARSRIPRVVEEEGVEYFLIFPEEEARGRGRPIDEAFWSLDAKLVFMDKLGIGQTVVSLGNPWLDHLDAGESLVWARRLNAEFAALESETGGRVVGLGVLPSGDVEAAVEVAMEAAETSGLYGVVTGSRLCGLLLDDERLGPLWAAFEETAFPVFLHPHYTAAIDELAGHGHSLPVALGFPFETTIAVARFALAGVFRRYPGLRIVAAHGGGTIPFLAARLDVGWRSEPTAQAQELGLPSEDLSRLYLDAVVYHPRALQAAADLVGTKHIVAGTDHPFFSGDQSASIRAVEEAFSGRAREEVLGGSAAALFRLPRLHPEVA
jgi:aminocarboxymuconate-semialdehyde decarboxylase